MGDTTFCGSCVPRSIRGNQVIYDRRDETAGSSFNRIPKFNPRVGGVLLFRIAIIAAVRLQLPRRSWIPGRTDHRSRRVGVHIQNRLEETANPLHKEFFVNIRIALGHPSAAIPFAIRY
jgi:hypothetical protein